MVKSNYMGGHSAHCGCDIFEITHCLPLPKNTCDVLYVFNSLCKVPFKLVGATWCSKQIQIFTSALSFAKHFKLGSCRFQTSYQWRQFLSAFFPEDSHNIISIYIYTYIYMIQWMSNSNWDIGAWTKSERDGACAVQPELCPRLQREA